MQWEQEAKLTASDAAELDNFGTMVKLHGNWAFVGAPADKDPNISASNTVGSVYVFLRQGANWVQVQKLTASDAAVQTSNRRFGTALDTDGNVLIVGERQGQSAYVFRRVGNTWAEEAILKKPAAHAAGNDQFATSVAIEGDLALVGAPTDDDNGLTNSGTVFAYRYLGGAWTEQPLIYATDAMANNRLGTSLAIDGATAAAGALQTSVGTGAVYVYTSAVMTDCNGNGEDDICELRQNPGLDASGNGNLDACDCMSNEDCVDNLNCTEESCDVITGNCVVTPMPNYCAIEGQCHSNDVLNSANECEICDVDRINIAWSAVADGTACGLATACVSGQCEGGRCILMPTSETCVINGQCVAAGAINPDNQCERCNPSASNTAWSARPNGTACDAPPAECRGDGLCQSGSCYAPLLYAGAPCGNPASSECDKPDTCSGNGFCLLNWVADATVCTENGVFCDGVAACTQGVCGGPVTPPCTVAGKPYCDESQDDCFACLEDSHCEDQDVCRVNYCSTVGTCGFYAAPIGTPCGNSSSTECDLPDSCLGSVCAANPRPNGTYCTGNGIFCDGVQACQAGFCTGPVFDPCAATPTRPHCSEELHSCVPCQSNAHCDDQLPCTTDTCSALGACLHTQLPVGTFCGPPVADDCGLRGRCNIFGSCVNSVAPNGSACIDDSEPCTLDYCDNAVCVHHLENLASQCGLNDCNCNGVPDECEIFRGTLNDCDGNEIPDECELPFYFATSARMSPIGYGHVQRITIPHPPDAAGQVSFTVHAESDLFASNEWIELYLNGSPVAQLFTTGANDCPATPDVRTAFLGTGPFNALVSGGDAELLLVPSNAVNADLCGADSYVRVELRYDAADPKDCNANLIPDNCELADGSALDIDPADGRLDSCTPLECLDQQTPAYSCRVQAGLGGNSPSPPNAIVQWDLTSLCSVADLKTEHFDAVDSRPSEVEPQVTGIVVSSQTASAQLSQLPQPFGWTCVSLRGSGTGACIGSLPADANGDHLANYLDVEALVNCCLAGECSDTVTTCDIDGSGMTSAEDSVVLIDLLNGAGDFEPEYNVLISTGSCTSLCGGPESVGCPNSYYFCRTELGACGFQGKPVGLCMNPPFYCPSIDAPVCGCDGGTYPNECEANKVRVSILHFGPCAP